MVKRFVMFPLLLFFLMASSSCSFNSSMASKESSEEFLYGAALISDSASIARLRTESFSGSVSSYDRTEGNADGFDGSNYLYEENGEKVLMDVIGAGTIYRMWFTGFDKDASIKITIDGEVVPSIDTKLISLFDQRHAPFKGLLSVSDVVSSGGFVSYVPISFSKSIKITTNGKGKSFFYNINYQLYQQGAKVAPYSGQESMDTIQKIWENVSKPMDNEGMKSKASTINSQAHKYVKLTSISGKNMIRSIRIKVPGISKSPGKLSKDNKEILNNLHLKILWDKSKEHAVNAPIGMFFAMGGHGYYKTKGLYVGIDDEDYLYCTFPMPFEKRADIYLESTLPYDISGIEYVISYLPLKENFKDYGYFKTQYRDAPTSGSSDILILDTKGQGQFVGVVQSVTSSKSQGWGGLGYLEGDEKGYIDGASTPAIHGTGTEDFYNGGWYFNHGVFTTPMAGYTHFHEDSKYTYTSMYRLMQGDAVTFRDGLKFTIEHGPGNNVSVNAKTLAYYYHREEPSMKLSDKLVIGDKTSEDAHKYNVSSVVSEEEMVSRHENLTASKFKAFSRNHNGTSEFTLKIDPKNDGGVLMRTFDQRMQNQSARVYVDDKFVGIWYFAGGNNFMLYRDTVFTIPSEYTQGKRSVKVKIEYLNTAIHWSEISYSMFSLAAQ